LIVLQGNVLASNAPAPLRNLLHRGSSEFLRAVHACLTGAASRGAVTCSFGVQPAKPETTDGASAAAERRCLDNDERAVVAALPCLDARGGFAKLWLNVCKSGKTRVWSLAVALDERVPRGAGAADLHADLMCFRRRAEDEARARAGLEDNCRRMEEQLHEALNARGDFEAKIVAAALALINQKKNKIVELQAQLDACEAQLADQGGGSSSSSSGGGRARRARAHGGGGGSVGGAGESSDDSQRPAMNMDSSESESSGDEDEDDDNGDDDDGGVASKKSGRDVAAPPAAGRKVPGRSVSAPAASSNYLTLGANTTRLANGSYAMDQSAFLSDSDDDSDSDSDGDIGSGKGLMPRRDGKLPQNATHFGGTLAGSKRPSSSSSSSSFGGSSTGAQKKQKKQKTRAVAESSDDDDIPF
jgi:hypothetical protein